MGRQHTNPENAGEENMTEEHIKRATDKEDDGLMENLTELFKFGMSPERRTRGLNWTGEELLVEIQNYFDFCSDKNLKPSKSGLRLYLGVSESQYFAWQKDSERYGIISELIRSAGDLMANQYINRGEKYPTFNMFMLKTKHEYQETNKFEVTTKTSADEIAEKLRQLGIAKDNGEE